MEDRCVNKKKKDGVDSSFVDQVLSSIGLRNKRSKQNYIKGKLFGPFSFINIAEGSEEVDNAGNSTRSLIEVAILMNIVQRLNRAWQCNSQKLSVCVLSPYEAQVKEVRRRLYNSHEKLNNIELKVKSSEGFREGDEADIVLLSTVRSNSAGIFGVSLDHQIANVALARARHCLWILGNSKTLAVSDSVWESIVVDAKKHKCFFNAEEDEDLTHVIIDVKSKLDELDNLLDNGSNIFKAARWKVIFSENFVKSFTKLPSTYSKKLVISFLLKLANGWRPKNKKTDVVCESSVRIAKKFQVEGRYIICTNDISRLPGYATQILKIWDILHLEDVPALVNRLDTIYGALNDDFLACCKEKCLQGYLEVPRSYPAFNFSRYKGINNASSTIFLDAGNGGRIIVENAKVKESLLLMKFYSLSAGVGSQLLSASDGAALNVPFEVSDEEREIIFYQKSTFILGRSGTGKTTVLVMRLFQKEQHHHMASGGFYVSDALMNGYTHNEPGRRGTSLCQLFLTVNPKLCSAVKQQIDYLRRFVHGEQQIANDVNVMDDDEKFKDVPDSFEEIPPHAFPLVITLEMFLMMLDRTLGSSYFDRFPDIRKIRHMETASSRMVIQMVKRKEVTYDKFRMSYWPHLNSELKKKLDPSRVFTEINSSIKGRLQFGESDDTKLSLQSYLQLSKSRVSNVSEIERGVIYKIFEDYEKRKVKRGEYDLADLVNDLHCRLKYEKFEGHLMDYVYIDEVQDLTMKQIALFKHICNNVEEGFVFAGDTAQTISRGVDFRFQDIRCLFYKEFLHILKAVGEEGKDEKGIMSPIFHLCQNFRTHAGIVNLAQSVVELIYHFFPKSVDALNPETSLLSGELPIFLDCGTRDDALIKIFQDKGNCSETRISFGSEQVIMVRDDCARDKLTNSIGRHALVLTIFECKGLEFEDVLLYNFFGSSPFKDQWRIIDEYMEKKLYPLNTKNYSNFIPSRHDVLCYELKQLYVAITRTRQRLWICEDSDGFSLPMTEYWKRLNLIQFEKFDEPFAQTMKVASSLEDWRCRGIKMLEVQNYKAAMQCFERSGALYWKTFARASDLRATADNLQGLKSDNSKKILREAAELFESINNIKKAAECYFDAEDYERAGDIYQQLDGESKPERACHCYIMAGLHSRVANIYARVGLFSKCLRSCDAGELFELGLKYIRSWKQLELEGSIDLITAEQDFLKKCAHAFYKKKDIKKMMDYVKDFDSQDSMRAFLKSVLCYEELAVLERNWGNIEECLNACNAGKLFELGLNYTRGWKLLELEGRIDLISAEQNFLKKCARASHKKRDIKKMMGYVRDFSSRNSMRTFLENSGCYKELAVLENEWGNILECLHACNAGKLFELALKYVRRWKQLEFGGSMDLIATEQDFLEKCAHASFKNNDNKKMMEFVKDFSSRDTMRTFLKSLGCYDELIHLERQWGNTLHEAELLVKTRNYQNASRLYIWYIFARSHWSCGGIGWPERDFPSRKLVSKVEASAKKCPSDLRLEVHREIMFLCSVRNELSVLKRWLVVCQGNGNLKWEIVITRRILDKLLQTHVSQYKLVSDLHETILDRKVSVETLIYFWKSWKDKILAILGQIECNQGTIARTTYWEFCTHYFGVRKSPDSGYFLLYPDAEWVAKFPQRPNHTIETQHLVSAIRSYWRSELLSVGHNMQEFLESLKFMPMSCKSSILVHISECAQFLLECKYLRQ